jgi:hypothetical protein
MGGGGKGGGGGGGGGQSYNFSQTTLPGWLDDASQQAVMSARNLSDRPFDPYTGQVVATPGADTNAAYQQVRDLQGGANPAFSTASGVYGGLLDQAHPITADQINQLSGQLYGGYTSNVVDPTRDLLGNYLGAASPATTGQVTQGALDIMSPYSAAVIDPAMQIGRQQLAQSLQQISGQANNVGAFGGSRQGVAEGVATAQQAIGAGQTVGDLLQKGWSTALPTSLDLAKTASAQGYGASGLLAQLMQGGYNAAGTEAGNIANTNLQTGMTATAQLPALALQEQAQKQKEASMLQTIGAAQQNQQQTELSAALGQHYEAQDWPVQNLDMLLSAVGAVPYGSSTFSYGKTQPDPARKNTAGSVLGGAASGASTGFMLGGPWGAAGGAVAGGILGALN